MESSSKLVYRPLTLHPALEVAEELVDAHTGVEVPLELYSQRSKLYYFCEGKHWECNNWVGNFSFVL